MNDAERAIKLARAVLDEPQCYHFYCPLLLPGMRREFEAADVIVHGHEMAEALLATDCNG